MKQIILLSEIDTEHSPVTRNEYRHEVSEQYAEQYRLGKKHGMPEPVLFKSGKSYIIGDGWHRINGMKIAGLKASTFEVKAGGLDECIQYACGSNTTHGLQRTNADKRQCVDLAIKSFTTMSNNAIAQMCCVGDGLVDSVRKCLEASGEVGATENRTGKDGKKRTTKKKDEDTSPVPKAGKVPSAGKKELDATGYPLTPKALLVWERKDEANEFMHGITELKLSLANSKKVDDALFREVSWNAVESAIDQLWVALKVIVPYAVCPSCQGNNADGCKLCDGRAMVSEFAYKRMPENLRKIRESIK